MVIQKKKQVIQKTGCVPLEFQLGKFQKKSQVQ